MNVRGWERYSTDRNTALLPTTAAQNREHIYKTANNAFGTAPSLIQYTRDMCSWSATNEGLSKRGAGKGRKTGRKNI